jgi:uncharacterized DUF497 family protein
MSDVPSKLGIPDWEFRIVFGRTKIDYDQDKEEANREKHGYSLESAVQQLERMILPIGAPPPCYTSDGYREGGEVRHMHMGVDDSGKIVLMVTTMRPGEAVRVISYRRASATERECFCRNTGYREPEG